MSQPTIDCPYLLPVYLAGFVALLLLPNIQPMSTAP